MGWQDFSLGHLVAFCGVAKARQAKIRQWERDAQVFLQPTKVVQETLCNRWASGALLREELVDCLCCIYTLLSSVLQAPGLGARPMQSGHYAGFRCVSS